MYVVGRLRCKRMLGRKGTTSRDPGVSLEGTGAALGILETPAAFPDALTARHP